MRHTSTKTVDYFRHNGQRYKRIEKEGKVAEADGEVTWKFFNTGWGEHGWLPLFRNGGDEISTAEKMEAMYQDL